MKAWHWVSKKVKPLGAVGIFHIMSFALTPWTFNTNHWLHIEFRIVNNHKQSKDIYGLYEAFRRFVPNFGSESALINRKHSEGRLQTFHGLTDDEIPALGTKKAKLEEPLCTDSSTVVRRPCCDHLLKWEAGSMCTSAKVTGRNSLGNMMCVYFWKCRRAWLPQHRARMFCWHIKTNASPALLGGIMVNRLEWAQRIENNFEDGVFVNKPGLLVTPCALTTVTCRPECRDKVSSRSRFIAV